jgi:hypothetical protein
MNLGITNSQASTWKRIKTQHIATAASAALLVSALVGGISFRNENSPGVSRAGSPVAASQPAQPQSFLYVVGSQAEADALLQGIATGGLDAGDSAYRNVMVVDTPAAAQDLRIMQGELELSGQANAVTVVDLR